MPNPRKYYQTQQQFHLDLAAAMKVRYDRLAYVRLLGFIAMVALIILAWNWGWVTGVLSCIVLLPAFVYGVKRHQALDQRRNYHEQRSTIALGELNALDHNFSAFENGESRLDPAHSYAADLDLFGPFSLYQYLNRSVTAAGQQQLADYLLSPAATPTIYLRQAAIEELSKTPEWCHHFRAKGANLRDDPDYFHRLMAWLSEEELVGNSRLLRAGRWFVPLFFILTVVGLFLLPTWQMALFGLIPVLLLMRRYSEAISRVHGFTAHAGHALSHYADLLETIERANWSAELLGELRAPVAGHQAASSKAIRQLRYAISQLDVRYNAFSALLEVSSLWSVQWISRLEAWRRNYRSVLPAWFATLAEIDALVSLANYRMNQPDFIFPAIETAPSYFANHLGHPLLHPDERVTNDLAMETNGHIHLVTGSNMAGKSTWLRTVGINVVLALAGAPVCATEMRLPQLKVWTSMRTQDALHESTSSFFAELKRLKAIIEAVEAKDGQVFFLLDEILKGTNSRDRHTGARALIRQLIKAKGAGIIATHDLELAAMENEVGSRVENYAMEVRIDEGELVFDYLLQRGVSQSFNATLLMARMGIRIDEQDIKLHHE